MSSSRKAKEYEPRKVWKPKGGRKLEISFASVLAVGFFGVWAFGEGSFAGVANANTAAVAKPGGAGFAVALAVFGTLFLNALFVAGEAAVLALRQAHIKRLKEDDDRRADRLQKLLDRQNTIAAACRFGSDVVRLSAVILVLLLVPGLLDYFSGVFGWSRENYNNQVITALIMLALIGAVNLLLEQIVKSYATIHPHGTASRLYSFIQITNMVFAVPAKALSWFGDMFTERFKAKKSHEIQNQAEEEIKTLVESAQETGEIEIDEKKLIHSVFEFTDTVAREVMTPRVDLDAMRIESEPAHVMEVIAETGHSRIPLYEGTDDQIVGIIHAKDLLMAMLNDSRPNLRKLMRPPLFVPENKNLYELLQELRLGRSQMAIVQDELGGTAGIVTIEDIVEELVGDIVDEYDVEEPTIVSTGDGWVVDGRKHIDDLNEEIGSEFPSEEFDTVGGLVFGLFGRQPKVNESLNSEGYKFTVIQTDGKRIQRLKIEKLPEDAALESAS